MSSSLNHNITFMDKKRGFMIALLPIVLSLSSPNLRAEETQRPTTSAASGEARPHGVFLDEFGVGSGYAWGSLNGGHDRFSAVPMYLRIGFDMNSLFGMHDRRSTLQLALEPFVNPVTAPDHGVETGLDVFVRYLHPLFPSVKLVSEIGSGPMYLSIDTHEQGKAGFNFLNQFGLGSQVALSDKWALTVGYRFRHLSNAGTSTPNAGINSNAVTVSISALY
jgi:opacity protein-like surface antigen